MSQIKIAAFLSSLIISTIGAADASETLRGSIQLSPSRTITHRQSGVSPAQHCIKVISPLYGQVACLDVNTGEFYQLREGGQVPSGTRIMTGARSRCHLRWMGAAIVISSNSDVIVDPDSHQVTVVRGRVHWVFMKSNQEIYTVKTRSSSFTTPNGHGDAAAFPMYDGISVLDAEGKERKVTAAN